MQIQLNSITALVVYIKNQTHFFHFFYFVMGDLLLLLKNLCSYQHMQGLNKNSSVIFQEVSQRYYLVFLITLEVRRLVPIQR